MKKILLPIMLFFVNILLGQNSQIESFELHSSQLGYDKKISVFLPKDYKTSQKIYKVIYMHYAQNLFDAKLSFAGEWQVDETLNLLNKDIIVVGIEHGNEKRIDELTPFKNEKYGGGKGNEYLEFIVQTVKPLVESKYRIKKGKSNTAIAGSSLGGLISFYATYKYPDVFGKAIVFSPAFWINPEVKKEFEAIKDYKARVYLLSGDAEDETMVSLMKEMNHLINTKRCECKKDNKVVVVKEGKHNEELWKNSFAEAVKWIF